MNIGTARAIFENIFDSKYSIEEKGNAIRTVIDMESHNSITKCQMLVCMNWMWEQIFELAQDVPDTNVGDMVSRQKAIDALCRRCDLVAEDDEPCTKKCNDIKILEKLPSAQPQGCSDILDELKDDDYYNYIHTGHSRFSEDDWDYLIHNAKEKEKLHERLDIKTSGD